MACVCGGSGWHGTDVTQMIKKIQDLMEVTHLQGLPNLQILWLCDNPCVGSSASDYRKRTIAMLRK